MFKVLVSILIFVLVFPLIQLYAQQETRTVLAGKISDAETGKPLVDVNVYLSSTVIGTSTNSSGMFKIINVPIGAFDMIVSHIGYERKAISLQVVKAESLYYEVNLQPQPVRTREAEITVEGFERAETKYLFFPKEQPDVYCIYGTVSSVPIGILFTGSALYMYSLENTVIDSEKYMQLWLLYKNLSETPYDFNPMKCLRLHVKGKTSTVQEVSPSLPGMIIPSLDTQKIASRITETFGVTLEALATKQSVFEWELYHTDLLFIMNPRPAILRPSKMGPARKGSLSATLYSIFENSSNVGIMERYIVYPGNSINGYIYFPFPGLNWKATGEWFYEAAEYEYELEIVTPDGSKTIEFRPN